MSVLISGMEMPNNCAECQLNHDAECAVKNCMVTDDCYVRRASWCPIILVPPHGRLIDADALYRRIKTECNPYGKPTINFDDGNKVMDIIVNAPTIIPAEEGK